MTDRQPPAVQPQVRAQLDRQVAHAVHGSAVEGQARL